MRISIAQAQRPEVLMCWFQDRATKVKTYHYLLGLARKPIPPELEKEFRRDFFQRKKHKRRAGLIGILFAAILFGLNQGGYTPRQHELLLEIHYFFCVILIVLVIIGLSTKSNLLSQIVMAAGVLITGGTYLAMEQVAPTSPQSEASQTTVVLIVIVIVACMVLGMRFAYAMFSSWVLFIAFSILSLGVFPLSNASWNVGAMGMACIIASLGAWSTEQSERNIFLLHKQAEVLVDNILPHSVAEQLMAKFRWDGTRLRLDSSHMTIGFDDVTILFADIEGFSKLAAIIHPKQLVEWLNEVFSTFDRLAKKHGVEKIKTIGDAYMVVGGLPEKTENHTEAIADLSIDMLNHFRRLKKPGNVNLRLRIGIHIGSVVAGVIGEEKFGYDLWGNTVNLASRMESHGEADRIHLSEATYFRLESQYQAKARGTINVKSFGKIKTYWLIKRR